MVMKNKSIALVNTTAIHRTQEGWLSTFNSAFIRRGFKVWFKTCQSCHGAAKAKYDFMIDKGFSQEEFITKVKDTPSISAWAPNAKSFLL
jgi:cytochrome c1